MVADAEKRAIALVEKRDGTDTTATDTAVAGGWKRYKVRLIPEARDCLWRIAGYRYIYRNARLWPRIYRANRGKIKNPDLIYPGQVFEIPPKRGSIRKPKGKVVKEEDTSKDDESTATDDTQNVP